MTYHLLLSINHVKITFASNRRNMGWYDARRKIYIITTPLVAIDRFLHSLSLAGESDLELIVRGEEHLRIFRAPTKPQIRRIQ